MRSPRTFAVASGRSCWPSGRSGLPAPALPAQQWVTETRDPKQTQDEDFAKAYREWTGEPRYGSPLVDHLPKVAGHSDRRRTSSATTSARRRS